MKQDETTQNDPLICTPDPSTKPSAHTHFIHMSTNTNTFTPDVTLNSIISKYNNYHYH